MNTSYQPLNSRFFINQFSLVQLRIILLLVIWASLNVHVLAQQFNVRLDASGSETSEVGYDIEFVNGQPIAISAADGSDLVNVTSFLFLDNLGNIIDQNSLAIPNVGVYPGWCNAIDEVPGGGFVHGGSLSVGDDDFVYAALLDEFADTVWTRIIEWEELETSDIGAKAKVFDEEILIVGFQSFSDQWDGIAIKLDLEGNILWKQSYGGDANESFSYLAESHVQGYFLSGHTRTEGGPDEDAWIVKISNDGEQEWSFIIDTPVTAPPAVIVTTQDGHYNLIVTLKNEDTAEQVSIIKIDEDGEEIWSKTYGEFHPRWHVCSAKELDNGDMILCGSRWSDEESQIMGMLMKCNANGDSLWVRTYTNVPGNHCELRDVIPNDFGGFTAIGWAYPDSQQGLNQDTWVIQTDSLGCIIPGCDVGVGRHDQLNFSLYPNPANNKVNIEFSSNMNHEQIRISLVALSGEMLVGERRPIGLRVHSLDIANIAAGMYILMAESDSSRGFRLLMIE